ncbi:MAG: hypothetical protein O3B73_00445, partial [bacterium]|nr:hypothetical protein [bacterium]
MGVLFLLAFGLMALVPSEGVTSMITDLSGESRNGQVFLTWAESDLPPGSTVTVYTSKRPITTANLPRATRLAHSIEPRSARDWWQDPASFFPDTAPGIPAGFVISDGAAPLDPSGGLFVHTATEITTGLSYFAVTWTPPDRMENRDLTPRENTLGDPIAVKRAPPAPVYIGTDTPLPSQTARGKALVFSLHGRGGGYTAGGEKPRQVNYLFFGDARQGWREGLAYKFEIEMTETAVRVMPNDRQWTGGRPLLESRDKRDFCPAASTWYYGYPERIYESLDYPNKVVPNYTEEQLLGIVRWAQAYLGVDPNQVYLTGGSMGGSGSVSLGFHHPHVFAHIDVNVPAVAYTPEGNLNRLNCFCGPLDDTVVTHTGEAFLVHMNSIVTAETATADLPFLVMRSGRTDRSIPWANKPAFYAAMNAARQAFVAYWSGGDHATADDGFPKESHYAPSREKIRLDRGYLAFSNCSDNDNPGNGSADDGDVEGWINRGLDWEDLVDTDGVYSVTVQAYYEGLVYPVWVDVTPRRVQAFHLSPGERVIARLGTGEAKSLRADKNGRLTIPGIQILNREGTRIHLSRD